MAAFFENVDDALAVGKETTEREIIASMAISLKRIADSLEFFHNLAHQILVLASKEEPDAAEVLKRVYGER